MQYEAKQALRYCVWVESSQTGSYPASHGHTSAQLPFKNLTIFLDEQKQSKYSSIRAEVIQTSAAIVAADEEVMAVVGEKEQQYHNSTTNNDHRKNYNNDNSNNKQARI